MLRRFHHTAVLRLCLWDPASHTHTHTHTQWEKLLPVMGLQQK